MRETSPPTSGSDGKSSAGSPWIRYSERPEEMTRPLWSGEARVTSASGSAATISAIVRAGTVIGPPSVTDAGTTHSTPSSRSVAQSFMPSTPGSISTFLSTGRLVCEETTRLTVCRLS